MLLVREGAVPEGLAGNELNCIPTVWGKVVSTMVSIFLVYPKRVFTKACLNVKLKYMKSASFLIPFKWPSSVPIVGLALTAVATESNTLKNMF